MSPNAPPQRTLAIYLWVLPLSFLWPGLQLLVFFVRFRRLPPEGLGAGLFFLPMGFISALVLVFLLQRARSRPQRLSTLAGYVLASPCALVGSLFSGLMFPPLIGPLLYGATPLLVGSVLGFVVGRRWSD